MNARDPATPSSEPEALKRDPDAPTTHTQTSSPEPDTGAEGFWSAYWERFRRQQVDDPVEDQREGLWDRFRRQQVDDPVEERRSRRSIGAAAWRPERTTSDAALCTSFMGVRLHRCGAVGRRVPPSSLSARRRVGQASV